MKLIFGASAAALAVVIAGIGSAQAQTIPSAEATAMAAKFGARQAVRTVGISPDGTRLVVVSAKTDGPGEVAAVINIADSKITPLLASKGEAAGERLTHCSFVTDANVICELYFTAGSGRDLDRATRIIGINADGTGLKQLTARANTRSFFKPRYGGGLIDLNVPGKPNAVLMQNYRAAQGTTGTLMTSRGEGLYVEAVDLTTGQRSSVETPRGKAVSFSTDGLGQVRLMATAGADGNGYSTGTTNYFFRPVTGSAWQPLSSVTDIGGMSTGFEPVAVDPKENVAYGFDANGNYKALFKRALDGSGTTSLVLSRPNTDVDGLLRIGRQQRIIGASYATEVRQVDFFDPELKKLSQSLAKALPGGPAIDIVDASHDESKLLLAAASDVDPGKFYLFDKGTRKLGELLPVRPELANVALGTMKPITYTAADGANIPGYLTLPAGSSGKNLPAIVMPHGGPGARDEWGFDWLAQFYAARGFAVLQPNFRGSTGYGAAWFQKNGFKSWPVAVSDVNDAGRWLEKQGIAAPGKLAIVGWSYGGYAALQSQVLDADLYKAVVAIAPVTDLDALRAEYFNTTDELVIERYIGRGPHVAAGSPARHASKFKAPVLLFHGDRDFNVGVAESRLMQDKLKDAGKSVEYIEFPKLDHQLDDSAARTRMLATSDTFLRKALGL